MSEQKVQIIGVGEDGLSSLTPAARKLIDQAEMLIGGEMTLSLVPESDAERVTFRGNLDEIVAKLEQSVDRRVAILTTGDPLFYGTARYLCDRLGKDRFEVVPHVSSMQLAFARVKESWDEAYLTNLATQNLDHVVEKIRTSEKAGIFTTESAPPPTIAKALLERQIDYFVAYVCENLGSPDERVTQGDLPEIAELTFPALNVMILIRKPDVPDRPIEMMGKRLFGNPDEAFLQSHPKRGLLTPVEVRTNALAELDLGPNSTVWDVGAGSGAVAIEAAQIAASGRVYAIEMDPEDHQMIAANAKRFGVSNLVPVLGQAPDVWSDLPDPDAVFVGGTGRAVADIARAAFERLRPGGRLVANVGSIENVTAVRHTLQELAGDSEVWMFNISRGTYQLVRLRFESLNPTFLLAAKKPTKS